MQWLLTWHSHDWPCEAAQEHAHTWSHKGQHSKMHLYLGSRRNAQGITSWDCGQHGKNDSADTGEEGKINFRPGIEPALRVLEECDYCDIACGVNPFGPRVDRRQMATSGV